MHERQEIHLQQLKESTVADLSEAYRAGAEEHGDMLMDKPLDWLLKNALKENTDQGTYIRTAMEKVVELQKKLRVATGASTGQLGPVGRSTLRFLAMETLMECQRAEYEHGTLTDLRHATRVLDTEVTELKMEMYNHADPSDNAVLGPYDRPPIDPARIRAEAIQVAATALLIAEKFGTLSQSQLDPRQIGRDRTGCE